MLVGDHRSELVHGGGCSLDDNALASLARFRFRIKQFPTHRGSDPANLLFGDLPGCGLLHAGSFSLANYHLPTRCGERSIAGDGISGHCGYWGDGLSRV